jgi:hypothetical protein
MDTFSQANISPELGVELMDALGVTALDLQTPDVYQKWTEVSKYMSRFSDAPAVARMVGRHSPLKERLAKIHEYVGLRQKLDTVKKQLSELPSSDTITGDTDEVRMQRNVLAQEEAMIVSELQRYEQ